MNLTVRREMSLLEIKIKLTGKRSPSKQQFHEMYPNLPTYAAQHEYSKSQNCGRKTEVKTGSSNILRNAESFEEKSPLQKVMLPLCLTGQNCYHRELTIFREII